MKRTVEFPVKSTLQHALYVACAVTNRALEVLGLRFSIRDGNRVCSRCGKCSFVYKCTVCGMKRCTSCGEWFFFYVLEKGDKSRVIKTEAFCSSNCEQKFLEPYVKRFYEEYLDKANLLLKNDRSRVERWFSSKMGYPEYDVWSQQMEKLFNKPRLEEALRTILSGKTQAVEFETFGEAMDLTTALIPYCPSPKAYFERVRIKRITDWFPSDFRRDSYFVFVEENWRKQGT